jgi:hypothetical protein
MIKIQLGCSTKEVLCQQIGLNPEYVEERIKTLFLDGKPVDDVACAMVRDGSTLALSAAMPGLVGATMRVGGKLAGFRSSITHQEDKGTTSTGEGMIVVKLFNLLVSELGPTFLEQGIWIKKEKLQEFFQAQPANFWAVCKAAQTNGEEANSRKLLGMEQSDGEALVHLRVFTAEREDFA